MCHLLALGQRRGGVAAFNIESPMSLHGPGLVKPTKESAAIAWKNVEALHEGSLLSSLCLAELAFTCESPQHGIARIKHRTKLAGSRHQALVMLSGRRVVPEIMLLF
jgi:hypothetical protein